MSIFLVDTYVVKAEKRIEFTPLFNEFLSYKEKYSQLFQGLKSWKLYKQDYGGISGLYIEMWEFERLSDLEKINTRIFEDEGMKKSAPIFTSSSNLQHFLLTAGSRFHNCREN